MPSNAFNALFLPLLEDAQHLDDAHQQLPVEVEGRLLRQAALNRAVVVTCVSAWEAFIEELVRESLEALRPLAPPLGLWPALNATVRGQLGRFNNPNMENVRLLISDAIGLPNVHHHWGWQGSTSLQAVSRLAVAMDLRHQIAHGVNPRPQIDRSYSTRLPGFFSRLALCTDRAVRSHLIDVHGLANPWPQ
jgi:hypothetical protein